MGKSTSATSYTKNNASVLLPIPHGQIDQCDLIHEKQCFCPAPHSTWANRPVRPHTRKTMLLSCSPFHMGQSTSATSYTKNNASVLLPIPHGPAILTIRTRSSAEVVGASVFAIKDGSLCLS